MLDRGMAFAIERVRARMRARAGLWGLAAGGAAVGLVNLSATLIAVPLTPRLWVAGLVGIAVTAWVMRGYWVVPPLMAALLIEREAGTLDNLVVTAVELSERPRAVPSAIRDEILRQAGQRLAQVDVAGSVPLRQPLVVMLAVAFGVVLLTTVGSDLAFVPPQTIGVGLQARTRGIDGITVEVVPPAYSGGREERVVNPLQISVIAGSRVRIVVASAADGVLAEIAGRPSLTFAPGREGFSGDWLAERSIAVAIRPEGGEGRDAKFLSVIVVPDAPPLVRVPAPGRDVVVAGPKGRIAIEVEAQDDLGLAALSVKFIKASGGGEALTFTEGEVALTVTRADARHWHGRADWVLDGLDLSEGDVLVYRAVARDRNPNGSVVQSEHYLVEVGRRSGAEGSGFAVPAEEKKYAISQQMVIYKTEQLIAARAQHAADWLEQTGLLAIEQRMVRAEVVFLGGGEVEDEIEEAQQSQDLVEGRLENVGRAEMLRAINFMSRAEAQLSGGKAAEALILEREALRSLERAFDRRRYFLRTLPDRSRIDTTRRLRGELKDARSWTRDRTRAEPAAVLDRQRALMRALAAVANAGVAVDAALAARVAALDPAEASLQQAAVALASATTEVGRRKAVWTAMQVVSAYALTSLGSAVDLRLSVDPLAGRLADELARPGRGRR